MTVVTYARRPARTSQAEPPRPDRNIQVAPPRVLEVWRGQRAGGIIRTIAVLSRPGAKPCVSINHWRDGRPAGSLMIFSAHIEIVRAGIAGAHAARPDRIDAGRINLGAGHEAVVFSRGGLLCLGKSAQSGAVRGLLTVLVGEEITALSRALDELAKRSTP